MEVTIERKRTVEDAGDLICTKSDKLYAIVQDAPERFPFLLICLATFQVVQNYDDLPSREELEEDIEESIEGIYEHSTAEITLN
ncbi:hypothetical protein [Shouchella shacheensis]|uniref:hypothetical protein n=1 Tax=Shouchella shacheensis TaxID=1649580 RepID=UPI00073FAD5A|nr:hypothetical protein [Shouchella shacheensis]